MQTAYIQPSPVQPSLAAASGETRTITMGRNRLNTIENWVKPPKPSRARALQAKPAAADRNPAEHIPADPIRNPEHGSLPRPVSQFVRTTTLAARR